MMGPGLIAAGGFAVGFVVGLTGTGCSTLIMPLLVLGIGLPARVAVGTTLFYGAITKSAGAFQHWRQGTVCYPLVRDFTAGGLPGTIVALLLMKWAFAAHPQRAEEWLVRLIALSIFGAAGLMTWRAAKARSTAREEPRDELRYNRAAIVLLGVVGGLLVTLTSVGAGTFTKAVLVLAVPLSSQRLVGTDLAHGALLTIAAAAVHVSLGNVDWAAVLPLAAGAIPGAVLGGRIAAMAPSRTLQVGVAAMLIVTATQIVLR